MAKFRIQKTSSTVNWTGKKILGLHTGNINVKSGNLEFNDHTVTSGEIVIDMASITITDIDDPVINQQFKNHLWDDDFFSIDKFPTSHLQVTRGVVLGKNQYELTGILSIKDIEHPVDFTARIEVFTDTLHSMGEIIIDRTMYNLRYGSGKFIDNLGDKLIHDEFVLQFKLVGHREN